MSLSFNNLRCLNHLRHVAPVNLNAHRPLGIVDGQFAHRTLHRTHKSLGRDELGIYHRSAETLAQTAESDVCYVFHRGEKQRFVRERYVANIHRSYVINYPLLVSQQMVCASCEHFHHPF